MSLIVLDDSGSMLFDEDGERIKDLRVILSRVVNAATLFDDDGISVRFINWSPPYRSSGDPPENFTQEKLDNIRSEQDVDRLMSAVPFKGTTALGTQLKAKILDPLVLDRARHGTLSKPVLIITITDGQPLGEPKNAVFDAIRDVSSELSRMPQFGAGAVSFQFAQVGNDEAATAFLAKLDSDPQVGRLVDCTSSMFLLPNAEFSTDTFDRSDFEREQAEMMKTSNVELTPDLWVS